MASLYVIRGKDNGQHFAIRGASATIGRESTNQIQLRDTEVSRKHARVVRAGVDEYKIVDNGSSNGTFVNSRQVQSQTLRSGDRIQVGRSLLIFTGGPEPYAGGAANSVQIVNADEVDDRSQIRSSIESHGLANLDMGHLSSLTPHAINRVGKPASSTAAEPVGENYNWEIVYQVSQAINRTVDLNDLLTQVLDLIFQWIECDRGCVLMMDDVTGLLAPIYSRDRKNALSPKDLTPSSVRPPLKISRTILDHVVSKKEGVLTSNAQDDSRWQDAESVTSLGVREAICVPMQGRYGMVGVIYIDTSMSAGKFAQRDASLCFNEEHLKLMLAIAGQAALAIEDTQFYRAMVQSERLAVMGQTIANLSHHVKNILQGISGGNYLVEEGIKNQNIDLVQQGWTIVERNQSRISNLVMDMLSFSKEREPLLVSNDLREVIDDVVGLMSTRASEANVTIDWKRPDQSIDVEFEPEAMHRAVLNVVTNAIDACQESDGPAGSNRQVTIQVAIKKDMARVQITDNGAGIPEEVRPRIFSPFESSKGSKGTGLGLPVTQKIVREHGGDIAFESELGKGTTFVLTWPCTQHRPGSATLPG